MFSVIECADIVNNMAITVVVYVLQDSSEADGIEDLWLLLGREVDSFGITAALNVEDTVVRPAVLIVTNEAALGIGRESGLAGSRETKEQRDIAVRTNVGRRVKRKDTSLGHIVVHDGEDALLHLSGVFGTEDDHLAVLEADSNRGLASNAFSKRVGRELASINDGEIWLTKALYLFFGRTNKHVVHEKSMVGTSTDYTDLETVLGIPAGISIKNINLVAGIEVFNSILAI